MTSLPPPVPHGGRPFEQPFDHQVYVELPRTRSQGAWWFAGGMLVAAALVVTVLLTRDGGGHTTEVGSPTTAVGAAPVVPTVAPDVVEVGTLPAAPITVGSPTQTVTVAATDTTVARETTPAPSSPADGGQLPSTTWNGQYTAAPPTEPLLIGHTGGRVRQLQQALIDGGFLTGPADGEFGPGTERAVVSFQRQAGLPADGIAGDDTRAALGLA